METPEKVTEWLVKNRKEDRRIEIKRSIEIINVDKGEVEKDSVAIANSALPDPVGWLVFGIEKSYAILGLVDLSGNKQLDDNVIEKRRQQYSQIAAGTNPRLRYEWCDFTYSNKRLIAVMIESRRYGHWYQTSKGAIFHRVDGHTYPADEQTISEWIAERTRSTENKERSPNINDLLAKIHSRKVPLSECFVEALTIASGIGDRKLESFCRNELNGWNEEELTKEAPSYRRLEVYMSLEQVDTSWLGWSSAENVMNFMMRNPDRFTFIKIALAQPISKIEAALPSDTKRDYLATITMPLTEVMARSKIPKSIDPSRSFAYAYATNSGVMSIIETIRVELSRRLLELTQQGVEASTTVESQSGSEHHKELKDQVLKVWLKNVNDASLMATSLDVSLTVGCDKVLLTDLKENHYPSLFVLNEQVEQARSMYKKKTRDLIKVILDAFAQLTNFPLHPQFGGELYEEQIAACLRDKHRGLDTRYTEPRRIMSPTPRIGGDAGTTYFVGKNAQSNDTFLNAIRQWSDDTLFKDVLQNEKNSIDDFYRKRKTLEAELSKLIHMSQLPGTCEFG